MADEGQEKVGLAAAVAATMDQSLPERSAEQLSLLPTQAAVEMSTDDDEAAERLGPGRPAGSRNKRTQEWVDFISSRYRSPLLFLAETYTRPVEVLAKELGCDREDAFRLQVAAAKELAPYVHQKQPVAVEVDAKGTVQLVINEAPIGAAAALPGDGAVVIDGTVVENGNGDISTAYEDEGGESRTTKVGQSGENDDETTS